MSNESAEHDPYEPSTIDDRERPKKSKAWIWAVVLGIGCFLPVVGCIAMTVIGGVSMVKMKERSEWVRPLAIEFIELGEAGRLDAAYDMCSERCRDEVSKEDLAEFFEQLDDLAGGFRALGTIKGLYMKSRNFENRTEVSFASDFEIGEVTLSFHFIEEGDDQMVEYFHFNTNESIVRRCANCQHANRSRKASFCEECGERLDAGDESAESETESVEPEIEIEESEQDD